MAIDGTGAYRNVRWNYSGVDTGHPWVAFAVPRVQHAASRISRMNGVRKVGINAGPRGLALVVYLSCKKPVVGLSMRRIAEDTARAIYTATDVAVYYGPGDLENKDDLWMPINLGPQQQSATVHWTDLKLAPALAGARGPEWTVLGVHDAQP